MNQKTIERAGKYDWENIPEDPIMSRISAHVYCAYRMKLGTEWNRGFVRNHYDRLYFVKSGEAVISTTEQEFHLRPGCCYLIASNLLHRHACTSQISMHWCHFQTILDGTTNLFQEISVPIEAHPDEATEYQALFQSLENSTKNRQPWSYLQRTALLLQLIQPHLKLADPSSTRTAEERRRFMPVLTFIDHHLNEVIRINDLANIMGLNKEYFSRFFSKNMGLSPKKYILQKRIQNAQKQLCYTDLQIQEIGEKSGFSDPYHFSKCFKKIAGISPTEYRHLYQQQGM